MARTTMVFGVLLALLGLYGFFTTGAAQPTALIPAYFGAVLILCGALAANPERRKTWMHVAAAVGLLGFIAPLGRLIPHWATAAPAAKYSQLAMCALCLVFTLLCVRSFIAARRARA